MTETMYIFPKTRMTIPLEKIMRNEKGILKSYRYSEGETTLDPEKQSKSAEKSYLHVTTNPMKVSDPLIKEMLDLMIKDGANIKIYEPKQVAEDKNIGIELTIDAFNKVKDAKDVELIPISYQLIGKQSLNTSIPEIRNLLYAKAQENPQETLDAFDSKKTHQFQYFASEAFGHGIIVEDYGGNQVIFPDNKEVLTSISKGETAIEAVANHFESKEGKSDYHVVANMLSTKLGNEKNEEVKAKATTASKPTTAKPADEK